MNITGTETEQEAPDIEHFETEGEVTEETEAAETPETEPEQDDPDLGYDFGNGVKFKTQKEALAYQQELLKAKELELAEANAYRQAILDQQARTSIPQAPPEDTFDEAEYYADPKAALQKVEQKILSKVEAARQQKAEDERVWNAFVSDHPDLADFRDDVERIVISEAQLFSTVARTRGEKAARDLAAQKVRAKMEKYIQATKPKKELPSTKSVTQSSSQTTVTPKTKQEKPMSMMEQIATLKQKRRG